MNKINGEANFDIDEDLEKKQIALPFEEKRSTKIDKFKEDLRNYIISSGSITNKEILDYALESGHPPKQATEVLYEMRDSKELSHFSYPKISSKQVYTNNNITTFEVSNAKDKNWMDGIYLESLDRLHKNQRGVQKLLCWKDVKTIASHGESELREWIPINDAWESTEVATVLEKTQNRVC